MKRASEDPISARTRTQKRSAVPESVHPLVGEVADAAWTPSPPEARHCAQCGRRPCDACRDALFPAPTPHCVACGQKVDPPCAQCQHPVRKSLQEEEGYLEEYIAEQKRVSRIVGTWLWILYALLMSLSLGVLWLSISSAVGSDKDTMWLPMFGFAFSISLICVMFPLALVLESITVIPLGTLYRHNLSNPDRKRISYRPRHSNLRHLEVGHRSWILHHHHPDSRPPIWGVSMDQRGRLYMPADVRAEQHAIAAAVIAYCEAAPTTDC